MKKARYDKMAVDFGTSNTVAAFWNEDAGDVELLRVPDVTLDFRFRNNGIVENIPYVPSLIHYESLEKSFVGYQVIERKLENSPGAFRWIKPFVQKGLQLRRPAGDGASVDFQRAGRDFLDKVLTFAAEEGRVDLESAEVAFTVPVESSEPYVQWLEETCPALGVRRYRFIDESTACVFGYAGERKDSPLKAGAAFLVFDFGGGTLDVSVVRMEDRVERGKGVFVAGKAGLDLGGRHIDGWLYAELLRRAGGQRGNVDASSIRFLMGIEGIKEELSAKRSCEYDIVEEKTGLRLRGVLHRHELEALLREKDLYKNVREVVEAALGRAEASGVGRDEIRKVLMVGGTSRVPSVREEVRGIFGDKVLFYRSHDAVVRGACRYLSDGAERLYDHIQHDYAIRSYDREKKTHRLAPLIPRGTTYPTCRDFKTFKIEGSRRGQRFLGLDIYEMAGEGICRTGLGEMLFGPDGGMVFGPEARDRAFSSEFWVNEKTPEFVEVDAREREGVPSVRVSFRVDEKKRLRATVRNASDGRLIHDDKEIARLR